MSKEKNPSSSISFTPFCFAYTLKTQCWDIPLYIAGCEAQHDAPLPDCCHHDTPLISPTEQAHCKLEWSPSFVCITCLGLVDWSTLAFAHRNGQARQCWVRLPHRLNLLLTRVLANKQKGGLARDAASDSAAVPLDNLCGFIPAQGLQVARDHKGLPCQAVRMSSWHSLQPYKCSLIATHLTHTRVMPDYTHLTSSAALSAFHEVQDIRNHKALPCQALRMPSGNIVHIEECTSL